MSIGLSFSVVLAVGLTVATHGGALSTWAPSPRPTEVLGDGVTRVTCVANATHLLGDRVAQATRDLPIEGPTWQAPGVLSRPRALSRHTPPNNRN